MGAGLESVGEGVDFARELRPLFRERCHTCHGALQQKAGLRVDTVAAMRKGGKSGPLFEPGRVVGSLLLERLEAADIGERMPPEHEGTALDAGQVERVRRWIAAGAPAPEGDVPEADPRDHWAFRAPRRPQVPRGEGVQSGRGWGLNPVDRFMARGHGERGLVPLGEAPREVLVRRLYFDLVGLPPSSGELAGVEADRGEGWYERLVDRLLADPRHAERWARHWMDVWRYSDAWGLGDQLRNSQRHLWHWRDWIVEALAADTPYDEMVRLMLAADELRPGDPSSLRATGYLARNYFLFNRNQWLEETVEHVGKGFLGLTLNCVKCHDHKYDPVPQADFYRFRAFFEPYHARVDMVPGEADLGRDGIPRAFDRMLGVPTHRFVRGQEGMPDTSAPMLPGVPAVLGLGLPEIVPVTLPLEAWQPERRAWVFENHRRVARAAVDEARRRVGAAGRVGGAGLEVAASQAALGWAEAELESLEARIRAMEVGWKGGEGGRVAADAARVAAVLGERRAAAARAKALVAERDMRLARGVAAGEREGLVKDLAAAREQQARAMAAVEAAVGDGESFTRLEGARWTPTRFLDSTKDDPEVGFPSTSTGRRSALAAWITDPRNPLTARVVVNQVWMRHLGAPLVPSVFDFGRKHPEPVHRELLDWLAVEFMEGGWSFRALHRRIVTSATYRMGSSLSGEVAARNLAVDPDNRWWWRREPARLESQGVRDALLAHAGRLDGTVGGPPVVASAQETSRRRSLYFQHSNNERNAFLAVFDDAAVKECYRREQSVVPQQALALMNGRLVQESAGAIAGVLEREGPALGGGVEDDPVFVLRAFRALLGIEAGAGELSEALGSLGRWRREGGGTGTGAGGETGDAGSPGVARRLLVWALLNHPDFVVIR